MSDKKEGAKIKADLEYFFQFLSEVKKKNVKSANVSQAKFCLVEISRNAEIPRRSSSLFNNEYRQIKKKSVAGASEVGQMLGATK
jgi:hypothetical protein